MSVVEQGVSGNVWYRLWSDGLIEQGMYNNTTAKGEETANKTFTFAKPFSNTKYGLVGVGFLIGGNGRQSVNKQTTGFSTSSDGNTSGTSGWYAYGY